MFRLVLKETLYMHTTFSLRDNQHSNYLTLSMIMRRCSLGVALARNTRGLGVCAQAGKAVIMIEIDVVILIQKCKLVNVIKPKVIQ